MQRQFGRKFPTTFKLIVLSAFAVLAALAPTKAQALELADSKIEIHGYGHQGFLLTDSNKFLNANTDGTWNYNALALLFSASVADNTTIWAQLFAGSNTNVRLDWAFVDYKFSNNLNIHAGQIKLPIGIYNEIRDVKYLQLSTLEPSMYQESSEMISEAFRGVGLQYNRDIAGGNIACDLYGGQPVIFEETPGSSLNQLIGGRISWKPPVEGLTLMGSASTSKAEEDFEAGRKITYLGSFDYANHNLDLKAEYAWQKLVNEKKYSYYVQAGYTFFDSLTPFVRYDYITTDKLDNSDPAFYQKDWVVGLGYKINSNVSIKVEDHFLRGFALPVASGEVDVLAGQGKKDWNLFAASINFIF